MAVSTSKQKKVKPEYWCYTCNRKFAQQASLQRHNKQHHGKNVQATQFVPSNSGAIGSIENHNYQENESYLSGEHFQHNGPEFSGATEHFTDYQTSEGYYQESFNENYTEEIDDTNHYDTTSQNLETDSQVIKTENYDYYYEGENEYEMKDGSQEETTVTENYVEGYGTEQYKTEDIYNEETGGYEEEYFEDIPKSENTNEGTSYQYVEGDYMDGHYYENDSSQVCESSFQTTAEGNGYYETEGDGYYNYNGEWEENELNGDTYLGGQTEGGAKRRPNSKGSSGSFHCSQCSKSFSNKSNLKRHFNSTHCFPCKVCSQKFADKTMMETHYKQEHLINCHICGKTFSNKSNMNRHIKTAHADAE